MEDEQPLAGGWQTDVRRAGDIVYRTAGAHSPTVIALLTHLHANGFTAAPRPIDGGFSLDGREQLAYVDGASPHPAAWDDDAAWQIGRLLRQLHETTAGFDPGPSPVWQPTFARSLPGARPTIGHGDLGPWNILTRDDEPRPERLPDALGSRLARPFRSVDARPSPRARSRHLTLTRRRHEPSRTAST